MIFFISLMLFLATLGLFAIGLIAPALVSKTLKRKMKRKEVLLQIGTTTLILFFVTVFAAPTPTKTVKNDVVSPTSSPLKANDNKSAVNLYASTVLDDIVPVMIKGNDKMMEASKHGQDLDFDLANRKFLEASALMEGAKAKLDKLAVPPGMQKTHDLLNKSLNKFIEGIDLARNGANTLDAKRITQGSELYEEGTTYLQQVKTELESAAGR